MVTDADLIFFSHQRLLVDPNPAKIENPSWPIYFSGPQYEIHQIRPANVLNCTFDFTIYFRHSREETQTNCK